MAQCDNCYHRKVCKMFANKFLNMPLRRVINGCKHYAPTADVEEVKHGYWKNIVEQELYCPDVKRTVTTTTQTCSSCKVRSGFVGPKTYLDDTHCPACVAKMDGGKAK